MKNQIVTQKQRHSDSKDRRGRVGRRRSLSRRLSLEFLEPRLLLTGTWTPITNLPPLPQGIANAVLFSDGRVGIPIFPPTTVPGTVSQVLTPDATGNYVNGTWSPFATMPDFNRINCAEEVLTDGRVMLLGGNPASLNNRDVNMGVIYDPVSNTWTAMANFPEATFGNGPAILLNDGRVLAGSIVGPQTYIYDPTTDVWSPGPTKLFGDGSKYESWTKLADGSILSYDVNSNPGEAQRLDPETMTWIDSGTVPVPLEAGISPYPNMGPGVLLPDGRLFQLGRSSQTAIYTPTSTPGGMGTWTAGPTIPDGLEAGGGAPNTPGGSCAAMMPNGHVLFVAEYPATPDPITTALIGPTRVFDFDPLANSLTDVTPPNTQLQTHSTDKTISMLVLPSGQVMMGYSFTAGASGGNLIMFYTPDGAPQTAWKPTITSIAANGNQFTLTGTQLNGLSDGVDRSVSSEMGSNYPIIELKGASGIVFFARTFNWSSTGVATGSTPVTTDFTLPSFLPAGTYSLTVIANGISSDPVPFVVPVVGDFNFDGQLTGADVPAMMSALADLKTFKTTFGLSDASLLSMGDLDGDHAVTNADLQVLLSQIVKQQNQPQLVAVAGSSPANLTAIGSTVYFTTNDGIHGNELWKTDGTAAGTVMVKDIRPGSQNSDPRYLTNVGGTLFFSANDGTDGRELWKSDGTAAGTVLVKDINPGSVNSYPNNLVNFGGTLYFRANDGSSGAELWKSDGTAAGTVLVKDINPGAANSYPSNLTIVGGLLYFTAADVTSGRELWKSDGTTAGTVQVVDLNPGSGSSNPSYLASTSGALFFSANDGVNGNELWKSDGTAAGTVLVKDINPGAPNSDPRYLTNVGGTLFFSAKDGTNGRELWKSDGTTAGTVLVKDINPGAANSYPDNLANVGGTLFFGANDGTSGAELWKSDGTAAGTVLVKDINSGAANSYPSILTVVGGTLLFSAADGTSGRELWKSDGTAAGTVQVADLNPGAANSSPAGLTNVGSTLFFTANDGRGTELWKLVLGTVTPPSNAPQMVLDINSTIAVGSSPENLLTIGNTTYFTADDGIHGRELWKTDGTAAGTVMVKDINPGKDSSNPQYLTELNGLLYFAADDGTDGTELWKSDGTESGTVMVEDLYPGTYYDQKTQAFRAYSSDPGPFTKFNGELFFPANDGIHGFELWKTDGTKDGTVLVKDIAPGSLDGLPYGGVYSFLTPIGGELYFAADDGDHGEELWKTDGTDAGTVLVKDIVPGSFGSVPYNLTNMNGTLFFDAYQDDTGNDELFKSDGTEAGTVLVADINPGPNSSFLYDPTPVNGILYFAANDGTHGYELWRSDGTTAGTQLVTDLNVGSTGSDPSYLTNVNGTLFFTANDGVHGSELWKTDGTASGTTLVKDINPGAAGSSIKNLVNVNGTLYFSANDGTHGNELWKSDGTAAGTVLVQDINLRSVDSNPANFTALGNTLLFTADDGFHGTELWKLQTGAGGGSSDAIAQLASAAIQAPLVSQVSSSDGGSLVSVTDATIRRHSARRVELLSKLPHLAGKFSTGDSEPVNAATVVTAIKPPVTSASPSAVFTTRLQSILPRFLGEGWGEGSEAASAPATSTGRQAASLLPTVGTNVLTQSQLTAIDQVLGSTIVNRMRRTRHAEIAPLNVYTLDEWLASD